MDRIQRDDALAPRWRGEPGRLEVWYATFSDPADGLGAWIHHELVSPATGDAYAHGWIALFRPGTAPVLERFGPDPVHWGRSGSPVVPAPAPTTLSLGSTAFTGTAGALTWDVRLEASAAPDDSWRPLCTFPAWAWERQLLPAAQVVPVPRAPVTGRIRTGDSERVLSAGTTGAIAHIYGHGSAERWGWLHADLGDGDLLEIVSAVSRLPGLDHLPPLGFVQLRVGGRDWPRDPLTVAPLFRTRLGLPEWTVRGTLGRRRLRVEIRIPTDNCVEVGYVDPDGSTATCTNSEVADAEVVLERRRSRWEVERAWSLIGSAHAEIGSRP